MKIAVIGCGGIGGVIAGALALHRHDVSCVEADGELASSLSQGGLRVYGKKGDFTARTKVHASLAEAGFSFDLIIVAVKSGALPHVFGEARDYLCRDGVIATIQNGLGALDLAQEYPESRILAGAVGFNAVRVGNEGFRVTADGGITFGSLNGAGRDDLFIIKGLLNPTIAVDVTENITGVLWSKLITVCGVTGLCGVAGLPVGGMLSMRTARKLFYATVGEGVSVADTLGVELAPFSGGVSPGKFAEGGLPLPIRYAMLMVAGMKYRSLRSNIEVSLTLGKRTEVDHLNGTMVRKGKEAGLPTPINEGIVRMIHEIEEGKRTMGVHNLEELAAIDC